MRTKAVLILVGFLLLISLVGYFWADSILAWSLEQSLQTVIGVKVDIQKFHLDPFKLSVRVGSLQIANPANTWKNLIDSKNISFKLSAEPLFEGKTVIDEIIVEDLTFNTPRRTDGKLKKMVLPGPLGNAQTKLYQGIAKMPVLNPKTIDENLDTEKLTASYHFKTDLSAERVKSELATYQTKWKADLKELENVKVELASIDNQITRIKSLNSKNVLELKEQLDLVKKTQGSVKNLKTKINTADDRFKMDKQALESSIKGLKEEAKEDYQSLLALAKIPDLGGLNYAEALLGKTMLNASTIFLKASAELQKALPVKVENPPKEEHPRGGQNITFPGRKTFPRFLIKKIAISGKGTPDTSLDGFYARGVLTGITSEPPIYGLPITADIFAKTPKQSQLKLDGRINHLSPSFRDQVNLKLTNLPLPKIDFPDSDYLPSKILSGKAEINAAFEMAPDSMDLNVFITGNNIKSIFNEVKDSHDLVGEVIRETLAGLNNVTVNYRLKRTKDQLEMKITSNLNDIISTRLKEVIGVKTDEFTHKLQAKVDAKLLEEQQKLEAIKLQYQKDLDAKLNEVQSKVNREEEKLQEKKKELEVKLQKELGRLKLKL